MAVLTNPESPPLPRRNRFEPVAGQVLRNHLPQLVPRIVAIILPIKGLAKTMLFIGDPGACPSRKIGALESPVSPLLIFLPVPFVGGAVLVEVLAETRFLVLDPAPVVVLACGLILVGPLAVFEVICPLTCILTPLVGDVDSLAVSSALYGLSLVDVPIWVLDTLEDWLGGVLRVFS